jgi:hypothetical protein
LTLVIAGCKFDTQIAENDTKSFPMKKIVMLYFVFGSVFSTMAQNKIKTDTLNIQQLNLYLIKANNMSSAGKIITITGFATSAATLALLLNYITKHGIFEPDQTEPNTYAILNLCGDAAMIVGIPLWLTGNNRKSKAQIALKKFEAKPENAFTVGLGLTIRF